MRRDGESSVGGEDGPRHQGGERATVARQPTGDERQTTSALSDLRGKKERQGEERWGNS